MERIKPKRTSWYLVLMIAFLITVSVSLGYLLVRQSKSSIVSLMQTRMLDISNTAAAMVDGDALKSVSPADEGTEAYESIMRTLTYFQDNIDLKYIYCIRDMGDGTFTFGLDPTVEDPGEFGSPIVRTEALEKASKGTPSADEVHYEDAWGSFYSAYSPVYDSKGEVAGIIAVDFSAEWYNQQLSTLTWTTIVVGVIALLVGGGIVVSIITQSERRIGSIHGQLDELATTLKQEMGTNTEGPEGTDVVHGSDDDASIDALEKHIQSMQTELKTQIAHVHGKAFTDGLTGVKSKQAYLETEEALNQKLTNGELPYFAIVVCDVNGLKRVNDTLGHKAGDEYIRAACTMVCDIFIHSPVYRVGGDEFVAILSGRDYDNRRVLMHELHKQSAAHILTHEAIVSGGLAEYVPDQDTRVQDVFMRADEAMYKEKKLLKSLGATTRDDESDATNRGSDFDDIVFIGKRRHILIADDMPSNREILGDLLSEDYDIYYACDGVETLQVLEEHGDDIALLLLDLRMPNMTGREVMARMQVDEDLMSIPIIVLTIDQDAELDCLKLGAMDFVSKPFPDIEIVKARIAKCIELSESRDLIRQTQHDKLTGLLNVEYFIRYVQRFDQQHEGETLDAVFCDVDRFREITSQYGEQFGDLMLRGIGMSIRQLVRKMGGIGCRKGDDTFLLYCPHQDDYEDLLQRFLDNLFVDEEVADKVWLKFGVFPNAGQEPNIEERFACAKVAADSMEDSTRICGYYDF